jgi:hypothetical protein
MSNHSSTVFLNGVLYSYSSVTKVEEYLITWEDVYKTLSEKQIKIRALKIELLKYA